MMRLPLSTLIIFTLSACGPDRNQLDHLKIDTSKTDEIARYLNGPDISAKVVSELDLNANGCEFRFELQNGHSLICQNARTADSLYDQSIAIFSYIWDRQSSPADKDRNRKTKNALFNKSISATFSSVRIDNLDRLSAETPPTIKTAFYVFVLKYPNVPDWFVRFDRANRSCKIIADRFVSVEQARSTLLKWVSEQTPKASQNDEDREFLTELSKCR